ncbi:predicted protein [Chaetoceros tenuissimus]|uniref:Uncharacterized protein n=1 Tax=Chaetoceros tenuissimus TaxID=426638 RepID=A0AAD3CQA6_9STRA|nr:predicted protein [Chaetoceros tenuissimus]
MTARVQFRPIPVDEEFCVLVEASKHEINCGRGRRPNYFELFHLANLVHNSFVPLPENMNHNTWIVFLCRMVDAKKHFQFQAYKTIPVILPYMFLLLVVPAFMNLCDDMKKQNNCNEEPPLWWFICVLTLPVPMIFILNKIGEGPTKEYKDTQEQVLKQMQLEFNCCGYSAELIAVKVCGCENRYVRFSPISESETERVKILVKEFKDVFIAQKNEEKNKPYEPASWKPLEG